MRWPLVLVFASLACEPAYTATVAPDDAVLELGCHGRESTRAPAVLEIGITFAAGQARRAYFLGCQHEGAFVEQLRLVRDSWCADVEVPERRIGGLTLGTTVSELSRKHGATLDDGEGYVAFNCGEWLDQLIADTSASTCCANTR